MLPTFSLVIVVVCADVDNADVIDVVLAAFSSIF